MLVLQVQLKGVSSTSAATFPGQFQQEASFKPIYKEVLDSSLKNSPWGLEHGTMLVAPFTIPGSTGVTPQRK